MLSRIESAKCSISSTWCSLNTVFFFKISLKFATSPTFGCSKNYQPIRVAVYLHCVENFEGLLQQCRRGRGRSKLWKNTIFPEHPVFIRKWISEKIKILRSWLYKLRSTQFAIKTCFLGCKTYVARGAAFIHEWFGTFHRNHPLCFHSQFPNIDHMQNQARPPQSLIAPMNASFLHFFRSLKP